MMSLRLVLLVAGAVLSAWGSAAIAAAHLTLKEVTQKVVLTNPEVLAKWHAFKAAGGDAEVARGGYFPRLDITTGVGRESLKQPGSNELDYTRSGYTLTLNQMLYDGFATSNEVKRLDKARLVRYFELVDAAENAALEAGRVYFDVIRYRLLLYLAENNYVEHRASYEQVLRRAQVGAGRRVDVEHAASRLALAELNLNTEAANLHDVTARYLRLVGERPAPVMFGPARLATGYPTSESEALKMAFRRNPSLRATIENIESAQHDLEVRRSAFHPKLDLRVRNEYTDNYQGVTGGRRNNVAEVLLSYNLFNGWADQARVRAYAERKNVALDLRDKSCRDIRQTLSIAYNDVQRLQIQLANLDLQVSSIERTRDAYKAQFNIGQRSLLDLLDTENELLNARRTAVNADVDMQFAYLRTQAGIGRLLEFLGLKRVEEQETPDPKDLAEIVESDICPPQGPSSYLVDIDALTAKAMAIIDSSKVPDSHAATTSSAPQRPAVATPGTVVPAKVPVAEENSKSDRASAAPASTGTVESRLAGWAAAWAAKDYGVYSRFYARSFVPADGVNRDDWATQRRKRLAQPASIRLQVKDVKVRALSEDAVVTEFEQIYASDRYSDRTRKTLQWVKEDGSWLINREAVRPMATAAGSKPEAGR